MGVYQVLGNRRKGGGGAKRIVRFWEGKRTMERALQNWLWMAQKVGFVWSVPVPFMKNDKGHRIIGGGVQNRFWGGVLWYVFLSPEFSTPPRGRAK